MAMLFDSKKTKQKWQLFDRIKARPWFESVAIGQYLKEKLIVKQDWYII